MAYAALTPDIVCVGVYYGYYTGTIVINSL